MKNKQVFLYERKAKEDLKAIEDILTVPIKKVQLDYSKTYS